MLHTGTFESTLDEKGRVVIPASLRDQYMGDLVITQGLESCVWIMTGAVFKDFLKTLDNLNDTLSYEEVEAFRYQHEAPARPAEIDQKTGRIPVPAALRSYAKLSKDCLVLSIDGHLEVWNKDEYSVFSGETQQIAKEAKKKLAGKVALFPKRGQA
ncbi:MAG: division/cell wall cluster transcriptional repressor MraZ [Treponema sp.]|nr:division/cell wall cluster transcriptional repressor MraZ [Treponema sp.]